VPDGSAPKRQRQSSVLEDRTGSHSRLVPTGSTDQSISLRRPGFPPTTPRAHKPLRPAERREIGSALLFAGKSLFQLQKSLRIVFSHP
jgi:hypothetical protein